MKYELVFSLLIFGAGVYSLVSGGIKIRNAVAIKRSDSVSVRETVQSTEANEFEGTVRAIDDDHTFVAPFAGEEAVLSNYEVTKISGSGTDTTYTDVASGEIVRPFLLEDEYECVAIDPTGATILTENFEAHAAKDTPFFRK